MRKLALFTVIVLCFALLVSCGRDEAPAGAESGTDGKTGEFDFYALPYGSGLDFWICQSVDEETDFEGFYRNKLFGGREYANAKYNVYHIGTEQIFPDKFVIYTVTAWPDYSDYSERGAYVTTIWISDPEVSLWGITVDSTIPEFETKMSELGFTVEYDEELQRYTATSPDGNYYILFDTKDGGYRGAKLRVVAPVSNRNGILF
ncbi:MAG: hypothetical protein IJS45_04620 [Clostridia bacterium]|nr:hypothetical protein [Clostridia bacterium]